MQDSRPVPAFRCDQIETNKLAKEWKAWKEGLECYFAAYDITDQYAKRAKLLHLGGPALQVVFKNLKDCNHVPLVTLEPKWYDCAIEKLDEFFEPRHQSTSERRKLRSMKQKKSERFADFVIRLKQQVSQCGFDKYGAEVSAILSDIYLTDTVVEGCNSNEVRRKVLLKDLTFSEIEALGIVHEGVDQQIDEIEIDQRPEKIFKIEQQGSSKKKFVSNPGKPMEKSCFNCGRLGHIAVSPICPARGKQCRNCKSYGHFERLCRKAKRSEDRKTDKFVRAVNENLNSTDVSKENTESNEAKVYYAFYSGNESNVITCEVGGVSLEMLIDSGADANLVSGEIWKKLKDEKVDVCSSTKGSSRILRAYGSSEPLIILGSFVAYISVNDKRIRAKFFVVEGGQRCLLGDETAKQLGVLKVGLNINSIEVHPFSKMNGVSATIRIDPQAVPVYQPMRRIPVPLEEAVDRKLDEMLKRDIIEIKTGPTTWVSPLVVVGKSNGDPRLCLDLRRVNAAVLREHHPMPSVDDYLAKLGRGRLWSKLDIKEAFLQIELSEDSRDATTFMTRRGLYRFKRLPFGLVTAPELFQKAMDETLSGCEGVFWYLDDVLVEGQDLKEHDERLEEVLSRLKNRGIELNWEKCQLRVTELNFLGHTISQDGIMPAKSKIQAIQLFREPQCEAEVRSFLGLANYLTKFVPMLATIDEPLRRLLRKEIKFEWNQEQANAFHAIKDAMGKIENLGFYRVEDHTAVITDASPYGLGAILIQFDEAGKHRVISFASKSLTDTERRYCQTEKEALAIVWGVERFQHYLLGKAFDIYTDCKALSFLFSQRSKPCARIERWVLRLQAFDYKVIFTSGKDNVADTLSRLSIQKAIPFDSSEEIFVREVVMYAVNSSALAWREIEQVSKADSEIQEVLRILQTGEIQNLPIVYRVIANELCDFQGVLIRGDRIVVPCSLREKVLLTAHEGHPGITMMKTHLRSHVWWPKMDAQVEKFVKNCRGCTLVGAPEPPEPLQRSQLPSYPWHTIALDFFGPLPEGQHLMTVIDYYSRFMEICEMETTTARDVIRELSIMFSRYGIPVILKADNAPQLSADCAEFKEFCEANGIRLMNTIPYWPQSNGEVERQNRSIIKRLRIAQELGNDWRQELYLYLLTYHSSKHPTTGKSPGEIMFGRRIKNKLPSISSFQEDAEVREQDALVKEKGKEYADQRRGAKQNILKEGDHVLAKRMRKSSKLDSNFSNEEFVIFRKKGTDTIIQSKDNGKQYRRSSAHLKKIGEQQHSSVDADANRCVGSSETENASIEDPVFKHPAAGLDKRVRVPPSRYHDYVPH